MTNPELIRFFGIQVEGYDAAHVLRYQQLVARAQEWQNHNDPKCDCGSCSWAREQIQINGLDNNRKMCEFEP